MRENFDPAPLVRPGTSQQVADLDVTTLHQVVLEGLLGLDEARLVQEGKITFLSRPADLIDQVRLADNKAGFIHRPTRVSQVWNVALSGQKMPQKSTNFYPKLITGLVINEL